MSDKPLVERLRFTVDNFESGSAYAIGMKDGLIDAINKIESFAAEHLTEQTEPSEEIKQKLREVAIDLGHKKADYAIAKLLETTAQWTINAERRRIRELLVGKETK